MQNKWDEQQVDQADAPSEHSHMSFEEKWNSKFFSTFPYPYMNGRLHLGHAYSSSKNEFSSRYQRMMGKNVLFPFAFHWTGMPIAAAAKRLVLEKQTEEVKDDKEKKVTQRDILISMGVPKEEIKNFEEPEYWIDYFTPLGIQDLKTYGISVDWRRSFITTSKNPYYDSFIQWQFNNLKAKDKISFGKRPAIYSIRDGQPWADHDRSEGEGAVPQEYTLIKLKMLEFPKEMDEFQDKNVFLVAATLRPETMYGQTNWFILPDGKYGIFKMPGDEYFVWSERAMKNMAHQDLTYEFGKWEQVGTIKGSSLIGVPLKAPLTKYEKVYTLPLLTISMSKGTGVVTSVPSDAPNDYAALMDFKEKVDLRKKYGVKEEWVKDFDPIPIIDIPPEETKEEGKEAQTEVIPMIAVELCKQMKINSQKDVKKLDEAKDIAYKKGFFSGIFSIGEYKGIKVSEVKDKIKESLIQSRQALVYYEPDKKVVSRSKDEWIVAKVDQWVLKYGEENWRKFVKDYVKSDDFTTYFKATRESFIGVIDWLKEWGLSRNFGLGTKVPWDEKFVIESLSDSTIYMAYYTVAHLLQGGVVDGSAPGSFGIKPKDLTHEVWDFIFLGKDYPEGWKIEKEKLEKLRNEFEYWYPLDLRWSGKDLIGNHLIMCLYNHAAIWEDKHKMPRSMYWNGYMLLNDQPMSKSKGNFLTLNEACDKYSSSATRMTIADAGDTLDDGNFRESVANASIMKQYVFGKWIEEEISKINHGELDYSNCESTYDEYDKIFENEMNKLITITNQMYSEMKFKLALKYGFHDMQILKDDYVQFKGNNLNPYLVMKFIEYQLSIMMPIIPHFWEHYYGDYFLPSISKSSINKKYPEFIVKARWPQVATYDSSRGKIYNFIKYWKHHFIVMHDKMTGHRKEQKLKQKKKMGTDSEEIKEEIELKSYENWIVFYANSYPEDQQATIKILTEIGYDNEFNPKENPINYLKEAFSDKKDLAKAMKYASILNSEVNQNRSLDSLDLNTTYNVKEIIEQHKVFIFGDIKIKNIDFKEKNEQWDIEGCKNSISAAVPGKPSIFFY